MQQRQQQQNSVSVVRCKLSTHRHAACALRNVCCDVGHQVLGVLALPVAPLDAAASNKAFGAGAGVAL
jgi:hypothetical protein